MQVKHIGDTPLSSLHNLA